MNSYEKYFFLQPVLFLFATFWHWKLSSYSKLQWKALHLKIEEKRIIPEKLQLYYWIGICYSTTQLLETNNFICLALFVFHYTNWPDWNVIKLKVGHKWLKVVWGFGRDSQWCAILVDNTTWPRGLQQELIICHQ